MKRFVFAVLSFLLVACSTAGEYERNLAKWQAAGIAHYRYDLVIGCFCPFYEDMPLTIEVQDGEVVSILRADGTPVEASNPSRDFYLKYATIDRLFAELQSEMREAEEVVVAYDPQYGFPADVSIDVIKLAMDDELSLRVANFEALE